MANPPDIATPPRLVDSQRRVHIPSSILQFLNLKPGDYVVFTAEKGVGVRLHKARWTLDPAKK